MADHDFLYFSSAYHLKVSLDGVRAFPVGLFKHLFRLVVHLLSFRRSVLHSTTAVFLDHMSRD